MSRSDNAAWKPGMHGLERHWASFSMPRGTGRWLRRQEAKAQRQRARTALREGEEPEPYRPRHSVIWNYW